MIKMHIGIKTKFAAAFVVMLCFLWASAQAGILDDTQTSKEIIIIKGEAKSLSVQNPSQVKIGNPKLLDVVGAGRNELLLSGLAAGETLLTVVDDYGQQIYTVKIFDEDLEKLGKRIGVLLEAAGFGQLTTKIGYDEGKIFIVGKIPQTMQADFESKIAPVSDKIINLVEYYEDTPSVEIDVEVLELNKDDLDNLGFVWNESIEFTEPSANVPGGNFPVDNLLNPKHTLLILKDWRTTQLTATLNLLKQNNKARTLSRPKLVCMSGKEAILLVGGEVPIITATTTATEGAATSSSESIELKEYGISLQIKPIVREDGMIQVGLNVDISDIDLTNQLTLSTGSTTPGFIKRTAQTELTLPNSKTVFLAGLIKSYNQDNRTEVPFLSRIPFLGALFRNKDLEQEDTEIVISLTPTIMRYNPVAEEKTAPSANTATPPRDYSVTRAVNTEVTQLSRKDDPVVGYSALIQNIINSNIQYPQDLREQDIEGSVKLSLHLLANGKLSGVIIMQSSGSTLLDEAAERSVKKLSPFPAFPSEIKLEELWIDMPIVYKK